MLGANPSKLRVGLDWCARGGFAVKTLAQSPSATPAPFSFRISLVIVNVIHFLYQLIVNEVSMDRKSNVFVALWVRGAGGKGARPCRAGVR